MATTDYESAIQHVTRTTWHAGPPWIVRIKPFLAKKVKVRAREYAQVGVKWTHGFDF